jgi:ABC-2 type transport system permease protein
VPTLAYVLLLYQYSEGSLDLRPIASAYLGTLLLGGAYLSVGILASTMTRNQIVAAMVTFGVCGILFLMWVLSFIPTDSELQEDLIEYLSIFSHMEHWAQGLVDTRHIVYCVSIMAFNLFCSIRALETRRWR